MLELISSIIYEHIFFSLGKAILFALSFGKIRATPDDRPFSSLVVSLIGLVGTILLFVAMAYVAVVKDDQIISNLQKYSASNVSLVPMRAIVGDDYDEVCLQTPYAQKEYYERETGHKVEGTYSGTDDTSLVWWLYGKGSQRRRVEIRIKDLPFRLVPDARLCHDINRSVVEFNRGFSKVTYTIRER